MTKQEQVLKFVREYQAEYGRAPSYREIGSHVGLGIGTVHYHLHRLEAEGRIEITLNIARGIRLLD